MIISLALFTPYKQLLERLVEKIIFRGKYDYQRLLRELSKSLSAILDFDQLFEYIIHVITQTIDVRAIAIFIADESGTFVLRAGMNTASGGAEEI